jgi:hypothetical protein
MSQRCHNRTYVADAARPETLDSFAGQALFIGPTMYASLSKNIAVSAAWSVQVAGHAVDIPGSLDLKNFERHRAQLRLMYNF